MLNCRRIANVVERSSKKAKCFFLHLAYRFYFLLMVSLRAAHFTDDAHLEISDLNGRLAGTYFLPASSSQAEVKNEDLKNGVTSI